MSALPWHMEPVGQVIGLISPPSQKLMVGQLALFDIAAVGLDALFHEAPLQ